MDQSLTLAEAASRLGVTRRRVQAMVDSGILPAERRGLQWFVPAEAVRLAGHNRDPRPGRPITSASAWAQIAELGDDPLARGDFDELHKRLRSRARHLSFYVHPSLLADLRRRRGVVLGGRDAASAVGAPVDPVEVDLYVREGDASAVLDEVSARPALDKANVFAHVVADDVWPFAHGQRHAGPWVAWLDLEDRQDRASVTLLDRLIGGRLRA